MSVLRYGMQAKKDEDPHGLLGIHRSEWLVDGQNGVDLASFGCSVLRTCCECLLLSTTTVAPPTRSVTRSTPPSLQRSHLPTSLSRGEAAPQMGLWVSGAPEHLTLQLHLHLSGCSASQSGLTVWSHS